MSEPPPLYWTKCKEPGSLSLHFWRAGPVGDDSLLSLWFVVWSEPHQRWVVYPYAGGSRYNPSAYAKTDDQGKAMAEQMYAQKCEEKQVKKLSAVKLKWEQSPEGDICAIAPSGEIYVVACEPFDENDLRRDAEEDNVWSWSVDGTPDGYSYLSAEEAKDAAQEYYDTHI